MRILFSVEQFEPCIGGMAEVAKKLSHEFIKLGHEVTIATTVHGGRNKSSLIKGLSIEEFDISGNQVFGYKFGDVERYRQFLLNSTHDVHYYFAAQQWSTDLALPLLDQIKAKKIFVPTGFSALYDVRYRDYFNDMKVYLKKMDHIIFLSEDYRDIHFAREIGCMNYSVIPNGVDPEEFKGESKVDIRKLLKIPKDHRIILSVGSHTGAKGHAELFSLFSRCELKNATLVIIGNGQSGGCGNVCKIKARIFNIMPFFPFGAVGMQKKILTFIYFLFNGLLHPGRLWPRKSVLVVELTREQTLAAFRQSDVFLFCSNIECSPLVLFESAAAGLPFLSVHVGNSFEIMKWTKMGLPLPTNFRDGFSYFNIFEMSETNSKIAQALELKNNAAPLSNRYHWSEIAKEYLRVFQVR